MVTETLIISVIIIIIILVQSKPLNKAWHQIKMCPTSVSLSLQGNQTNTAVFYNPKILQSTKQHISIFVREIGK